MVCIAQMLKMFCLSCSNLTNNLYLQSINFLVVDKYINKSGNTDELVKEFRMIQKKTIVQNGKRKNFPKTFANPLMKVCINAALKLFNKETSCGSMSMDGDTLSALRNSATKAEAF